jgi:DNA polymerase-4
MIISVFLADFAVIAARASDADLQEQPLILTHDTARRTLVFAASAKARVAGVTPGMGLARAQALCPEASIAPVVHIRLRQAADALLEHLSRFSSRLEIDVKDSAMLWLDVGDITRPEAVSQGQAIGEQIAEIASYTVAVGVAANKFTAQIAAVTAVSGQVQHVTPGKEAAFLAGFPLARLALGGPLIHQFRLLGLETLGQFAALSRVAVYDRFGTVGKQLYARAQGIDPRPVMTYTPHQITSWKQDFEPVVTDRQIVEYALRQAAGTLAEQLKRKNLAAGSITLLMYLDNRHTLELRQQPREAAMSVFALSTELLRLLKEAVISAPLTSLEVVLADLHEPVPVQLDFFGQLFADSASVETVATRLYPRQRSAGFYTVRPVAQAGYVPEHIFVLERLAGG